MPDILAIVSKAVFEKAARGLGAGDTWPTAAYTSGNKALEALAGGGALFLVTVRPGNVLWLVAILDAPKLAEDAWRAAANTVPITDVTSLIPTFAFASGKGLVRDDKLGMSLQTPRELSAATAAALRALGRGDAVTASPSAVTASTAASSTATAAKATAAKAAPAKATTKATLPAGAAGLPRPIYADLPAPPRPAGVPVEATWDPLDESWEHGAIDEHGSRQGAWQFWRTDGSKRGECTYLDHDLHGVNRRFHPDGSIASEGAWRHGVMHDAVFFAPRGETDEPPLLEGGPEVVRCEYPATADGSANASIRYLDAEGRQRDRRGVMVPPRPASVPETARWFSDEDFHPPDGTIGGWVDGPIERGTQRKLGEWRWWSTAGEWLRTERYDARGKRLSIATSAEDQADTRIAAWYANPKSGIYDLARAWSPALHERMRDELRARPVRYVREYAYLLDEGIEEYGDGWTRKISQPRSVIDVVEDWEARPASDTEPVDAWFLVGAGARAALAVRDRARLERWWKRFVTLAMPTKFPDDTYAFGRLRSALDKKGELRAKIAAALDGSEATAVATTEAAMRTPATARGVDDAALALFTEVSLGVPACEVMVRDPATGEAWLADDDNRTHYWNGRAFAPTTVVFDTRVRHHLRYVNQHAACDERMLLWPGKLGWIALQRYGKSVFWHAAKYYASRGQPEVERALWFTAASPAAAHRMMQIVRSASKSARLVDPWCDPKLGVIVRRYSGGVCALGIHDRELGTGRRFLEAFDSHADAVRAFEAIEIERLRSGLTLSRFTAMGLEED